MTNQTLAVIVGNRIFFLTGSSVRRDGNTWPCSPRWTWSPSSWAKPPRSSAASRPGRMPNVAPSCSAATRDDIDGILVVFAQFRRREGCRRHHQALRPAACPILVQAYPDDLDQLHVERRRDAFCGKISVCNNLRQYGYPFTPHRRAHGPSARPGTSGRTWRVPRRLPRGQRAARRAPGRNRRAARRVQHRAL